MTASIYKSLLHESTVYTENSHVGGEVGNSLQGTTYNYWKPNAIGSQNAYFEIDLGAAYAMDYYAFDVHNLLEISTLTEVYCIGSNDPLFITGSSPLLGELLKANIVAGANVVEFTNASAYRYWRFVIYDSSQFTVDPVVGVVYMGITLDLPNGIKPSYTPPRLGVVSEVLNNTSDGGNFIGRSYKRKNYDFVIKNDLVLKTWIDSNWITLLDYILEKPFFYRWNDVYPDESVFCWTVGNITPPRFSDQVHLSFSFRCNGFL